MWVFVPAPQNSEVLGFVCIFSPCCLRKSGSFHFRALSLEHGVRSRCFLLFAGCAAAAAAVEAPVAEFLPHSALSATMLHWQCFLSLTLSLLSLSPSRVKDSPVCWKIFFVLNFCKWSTYNKPSRVERGLRRIVSVQTEGKGTVVLVDQHPGGHLQVHTHGDVSYCCLLSLFLCLSSPSWGSCSTGGGGGLEREGRRNFRAAGALGYA